MVWHALRHNSQLEYATAGGPPGTDESHVVWIVDCGVERMLINYGWQVVQGSDMELEADACTPTQSANPGARGSADLGLESEQLGCVTMQL